MKRKKPDRKTKIYCKGKQHILNIINTDNRYIKKKTLETNSIQNMDNTYECQVNTHIPTLMYLPGMVLNE